MPVTAIIHRIVRESNVKSLFGGHCAGRRSFMHSDCLVCWFENDEEVSIDDFMRFVVQNLIAAGNAVVVGYGTR